MLTLRENVTPGLGRILRYVAARSGMYAGLWRDAGVMRPIENLTGPANRSDLPQRESTDLLGELLGELPLTEKHHLIDDQQAHPPFGSNLCVPADQIQRVQKTSGSRSRPVMIALTEADIDTTTAVGAACFRASGLGPGHTVVHCLNYCLWMGGYTDHQSLERTGATVIPYGVGQSEALIELMQQLRPTAIHCTPSYLSRLETVIAQRFPGLAPAALGLKLGLFAGESGLQYPAFRKHLADTWGLRPVNANYGVSELLSMLASECDQQDGLHFMAGDVVLPELIDPVTFNPRAIEPGAQGELVLTNLVKQAQPLIRYRTRDVIRIVATEPCVCGRSSFRFQVVGRSDDMLVIKGINVFPDTVGLALAPFAGQLNGQFQIVTTQAQPRQSLTVRVELAEPTADQTSEALQTLHTQITSRLKQALTIRPDVHVLDPGSLPRVEGKRQPVVLV